MVFVSIEKKTKTTLADQYGKLLCSKVIIRWKNKFNDKKATANADGIGVQFLFKEPPVSMPSAHNIPICSITL
jgi:hypothetical protein